MAPKPTSQPSRKSKSVGERPSKLPVGVDNVASPSAEGHDESPEKLSLKARLKLFEKEIEQQGSAAPAPKPGKLQNSINRCCQIESTRLFNRNIILQCL